MYLRACSLVGVVSMGNKKRDGMISAITHNDLSFPSTPDALPNHNPSQQILSIQRVSQRNKLFQPLLKVEHIHAADKPHNLSASRRKVVLPA